MKTTAILLAAGQGKRMGGAVAKQYLPLLGKPVLYYSLRAFEEAKEVDSVILVVGEEEKETVSETIIRQYGFQKVEAVVTGGQERYLSVYQGLQAADCDYVLIHDSARPMLDGEMIRRIFHEAVKEKAAVAAVPVKDTIKFADEKGYIRETLDREALWSIQTPQAFETALLKEAYRVFMEQERSLKEGGIRITDDAMMVETFSDVKVKLVTGSYENIKVTTTEDLSVLEVFCRRKEGKQG